MSVAVVKLFESAMNGTFDLTEMLNKINTHHIIGNLNDVERDSLVRIARGKADPTGSMDVLAKLQELDERVRALEAYHAADGGAAEDDNTEAVEEYTAGKWYRNGDQVMFNGKLYKCIAPADGVCVWSPAEYPAYWETVN